MKAGLFSLAVVSLLHLALATPRIAHKHHKRARTVVTKVDYVTADSANVIVYVDQHGKPVSTTTLYHAGSHPTPAPQAPAENHNAAPVAPPAQPPHPAHPQNHPASPPPYQAPPAPAPKPQPPPPAKQPSPPPPPQKPAPPAPPPAKPPTVPVAPSHPSPPSKPPPGGDSGPVNFGSAVSYSPYNADNSCKSLSQVQSDFAVIKGFEVIRLYGTDCNQVSNVIAATKDKNMKLFLGIFDINNIDQEAQTISSAVNHNWDQVVTVSVGNELVNSGKASVPQVVSALGKAKSCLASGGYTGPIVTVDTMVAMKANPDLCKASSYCAINCHAFFDGKVVAENAGPFVLGWVQQVSQAAGGKNTVVVETGWPHQGQPNGVAVPSPENHQKAIDSIKGSFSNNAILYGAFNDLWKKNSASTFGAEQYWGIYGDAP